VAMTHNGDVTTWQFGRTATHWVVYPIAVFGATLPWSAFLLLFLSPSFRNTLGQARQPVLYLAVCLAVAFPTCWIPQGGLVRYFAPLYPCMAVLIGLAIQRCVEAEATSNLVAVLRGYFAIMVCAFGVMGLLVVGMAGFRGINPVAGRFAEPPVAGLLFAAAFAVLAVMVARNRHSREPIHVRLALMGIAAGMSLAITGAYLNTRVRLCEYQAADMQRLKEKLPPGQRLVSFGGGFDCTFTYYYGMPVIDPIPWPKDDNPDLTYFCFMSPGASRPTLPFAWEELGAISVDRLHHEVPEWVAVVGRRVPDQSGPRPASTVGRSSEP
jgi:hypothetical protein